MDEQELNKKLAEWAGFISEYPDRVWSIWVLWGEPDPVTLIRKKLGSGMLSKGLNFTQSLDACFKWLVPKLGRNVSELGYIGFQGWVTYHISINFRDRIGWRKVYGEAETPALALCLAVEKVIDSKYQAGQSEAATGRD